MDKFMYLVKEVSRKKSPNALFKNIGTIIAYVSGSDDPDKTEKKLISEEFALIKIEKVLIAREFALIKIEKVLIAREFALIKQEKLLIAREFASINRKSRCEARRSMQKFSIRLLKIRASKIHINGRVHKRRTNE
ncbi:hypothetical protein [Neobacillus sp. LXY-1]|uniref:hypothetical protein n=1 Tax=Neobacillus sp. LXY-1 TaxID=3379133 RepID=UPI003EE39587